jgi:outer membrane protein OmpA-like peptidoglycan-associated protein
MRAAAAVAVFLAAALPALAAAQETTGTIEAEPREVTAIVRDLQAEPRDLVFIEHDLAFVDRDLDAVPRDLLFPVIDLGAKPRDLAVKESATEVRIELAADVLFDFDKADIRPKAQEALKQVASLIRERGKLRSPVVIEGHTDGKGSDSYNQKLSDRRAAAVKTWLVQEEGLKDVSFRTQGFGAKRPVAPNTKPDGSDDPDGRQKNRRVEIVLRK